MTNIDNLSMLTAPIPADLSPYTSWPAVLRGTLAWDGASSVWLDNPRVYVQTAPRQYTEVYRQ
jgi:hypothetical protein